MLRKQLSEEGVAKLKPPATGQVDYFDTLLPGLILRVGYGGSKTWLVRHYLKCRDEDGKKTSIPTTHKIGRHPILAVKEARNKARLFLTDPVKAKAVDTGSFRDEAENFVKRYVEAEKKLRTQDEIERLLKTLVYPHWQDRPFRDIKRGDVADLLDHVVDNNGARQADKALAIIRKMMNWYATRNGDYVSPVVKGMGRYHVAKRKRVLGNVGINGGYDDAEIRAVWKACGDMGTFGALIKTLLLTAQRKEKVTSMKWDDVRGGVWTIPQEDRQKPNAESLRLPPAVLDIINAQPRIADNPYVFAGRGRGPINSTHGKKALNQKLSDMARKQKLPDMPPWVIHDLRRTAKTLMGRAGVRPDISERVLGHTIPGVEGVYDQFDYDSDKADALIKLAALVEKIINPPSGNVTDIEHPQGVPARPELSGQRGPRQSRASGAPSS
jgi:integrase